VGEGPDRPDDTDPAVADTQTSDEDPKPPVEEPARRLRAVGAGDSLGRYDLAEDIGEGGMATVYRARDRELRRDVAVKVLFPHLARRPDVVRRFHREARAAAGLEHPNILRIYDVGGGEGEDPPFIVMELIRGRTLMAEIEQRGAILAEVVACVGALLADALAAAHAAGVIHRDIKPANVLIAGGGRLLLADFGVARLETEDSLVTRTGALLGTPAYMSPEQASGDTATVKSDLYSLGATLYQMSTGSLPYSGTAARVMSQIASGSLVPPVRRRPSVGPDLSRVIENLMATEPTLRPGKAAEVAAELRALVAAGGLGDAGEELAAYFDNPESFVRDRTPAVVTALVSAGKQAIAQSRLTRAMALADRANELAPDDPAVKTLVETVTEGGRASKRRRALAIVGGGMALAAGATVLVVVTMGGSPQASPDAGSIVASVVLDAPGRAIDAVVIAEITERDAAVIIDAAPPRRIDARVVTTVHLDAATPDAAISIDATPLPIDAPPIETPGRIVVTSDMWCELKIDDKAHGRASPSRQIAVTPGHHTIRCEQPGLSHQWSQDIDIAAGQILRLKATLGADIDVTIAVTRGSEVMIGRTHYQPTATTRLPAATRSPCRESTRSSCRSRMRARSGMSRSSIVIERLTSLSRSTRAAFDDSW